MTVAADQLDSFRRRAGLTLDSLWFRYLALGGLADRLELEAALAGLLVLEPRQTDALAHALNERFLELELAVRVPYGTTPDAKALAAVERLLTAPVLEVGTPPHDARRLAPTAGSTGVIYGRTPGLEFAIARRAGDASLAGWCDVFSQPDGTTWVAAGSATGQGRSAADVRAEARLLLRGLVYSMGAPPAQLLAAFGRALPALSATARASVTLVQVSPLLAGDGWRVRWSSAGLLPPLVRTRDGAAAALGETDPADLGGGSAARPRDNDTELPTGSTLLVALYPATEASDDAEVAGALESIRSLASAPLETLCEGLLGGLSPNDASKQAGVVCALRLPSGAVSGSQRHIAGVCD